jgi:hypothetical protein
LSQGSEGREFLQDPDFGAEGRGVFATISLTLTERDASAAAFWKRRIEAGRE